MAAATQIEAFRITDLPEDDVQALMASIYHHAERNMENYRREAIGDMGIWDIADSIEDALSSIRNVDLTGANIPDQIKQHRRIFSTAERYPRRAAADLLKESV